MEEKEKSELIQTFLEMPDGRLKAIEAGLENLFDEEIQRLRRKPKLSFKERSILAFDALAKQGPLTYEQKLEQVQRVNNQIKGKNKRS